ncbi:MAG: hypothetical protein HY738_07875 [Bacteroidia bacterium]|nr:hypothetical protein [Bacteroidia bacterium]
MVLLQVTPIPQAAIILLGYMADGTADLTNATALGSEAIVKNSYNMILGNNSMRVGLGLSGEPTGPQNNLEIRATDINGNPVSNASGLQFRNLKETSTVHDPNITNTVLSVDDLGNVILVNDQTGTGGGNPAPPLQSVQFNKGGIWGSCFTIYEI